MIDEVLAKAASQVGVREQPLGSNAGPQVNAYLRATGLGPGYFWCDAFVAWVYQEVEAETGQKIPCVKTASCDVSLAFGRAHECLYTTPERGDQFLVLASEDDATHTGLVSAVNDDGTFNTFEGNTNDDGSSNGIGVFARTRQLGSHYRFIRWEQLLDANDTYALMLDGSKVADMPVAAGVARVAARVWGNALGFAVDWDAEAQAVTFDGSPVPSQPLVLDGVAYLPIRALAEAAGLALAVDNAARVVTVSRAA